MKNFTRIAALLVCVAMIFGFTGCDSPVTENIPTYYTVTFNSNGGSAVEKQIVASGSKATMPGIPTKAATPEATFTFAGWYSDANLSTAFNFDTPITADITLYARWNTIPVQNTPTPEATYTVTISESIENGTVTASKTSGIKAGETITLTATPANGYMLDSLSVKNGDTDITITNNTFTMPAANVTVSATFEALPPNTYSVTFNSMGGTAVTEQTVTDGNKATRPDDPTKAATTTESYAFDNWYTSTDGGTTLSATAFDFNTPITSSIVLYAKWNVTNLYSVTISATTNGTVVADKTSGIAAGETVTLTITPADYYMLHSISATSNGNPVSLNVDGNTRTFTMPAANVNVTASFVITKIGTKKMPNAVGDIVFNDGTALPASVYNTRELTDREKQNAIAVVADVDGGNAMAVGLKQEYLPICSNTSQGYTNTAAFSHDGDAGQTRQEICYGENDYITDYSQANYPAIYWAQNYKGFNNLKSINNDWFIPTKQELLYVCAGKESVIAAINKIGSQYANPFIKQDEDEPYYSTVTNSSNSSSIYQVNLNNGSTAGQYKDTYSPVLVIRYFYCGN